MQIKDRVIGFFQLLVECNLDASLDAISQRIVVTKCIVGSNNQRISLTEAKALESLNTLTQTVGQYAVARTRFAGIPIVKDG